MMMAAVHGKARRRIRPKQLPKICVGDEEHADAAMTKPLRTKNTKTAKLPEMTTTSGEKAKAFSQLGTEGLPSEPK